MSRAEFPLDEWASMVLPPSSKLRLVAMLYGYFDESGTHPTSERVVISGFLGTAADWMLVRERWKAALGGRRFSICGVKIEVPITASVTAGEKVSFGIRPEHLEAENGVVLPVTTEAVEQLGSTSYLHGKVSSGETIIAEKRLSQSHVKGQTTVTFDPVDVRIFDSNEKRIR